MLYYKRLEPEYFVILTGLSRGVTVEANASLNSVRELDTATLDQIQRACLEQTEKLDEAQPKSEN
jgi:hypothetical protein